MNITATATLTNPEGRLTRLAYRAYKLAKNGNWPHWDPATLEPLLTPFIGGQFRLVKLPPKGQPSEKGRKKMLELHGKIQSIKIPNKKIKHIVISFDWLCEKRNNRWALIPWEGKYELPVDYIVFYSQVRKGRLKSKNWGGEFCRFYRPGDPDNLSEKDFLEEDSS